MLTADRTLPDTSTASLIPSCASTISAAAVTTTTPAVLALPLPFPLLPAPQTLSGDSILIRRQEETGLECALAHPVHFIL
jgi:hypothetical protein